MSKNLLLKVPVVLLTLVLLTQIILFGFLKIGDDVVLGFLSGFGLIISLVMLIGVFKGAGNKSGAIEQPKPIERVAPQHVAEKPVVTVVPEKAPTVSPDEYDMRKALANTYLILCAINGIRNLIRDENDTVRQRLDKLSSMVYYMYYSQPTLVPLRKEVENMRTYLEFQRLKMRKNLEIKYVFPNSFRRVQIQSLTLLPFLADIFRKADGRLRMDCRLNERDNVIVFEVTYSMPQDADNSSATIGGDAFERLRRRLSEKYEGRHEFSINRAASSTSIRIQIDASADSVQRQQPEDKNDEQ